MADAAVGARALTVALPPAGADLWADLVTARRRARGALRGDHPHELGFLEAFARVVGDDVTVVADMCIPGYWLAAMHQPAGPRRFQYPMGWGHAGLRVPCGARRGGGRPGAQRLRRRRLPLRLRRAGDAKQDGLPLTALVVDDGGYGMLRFDQRHSGAETYGVDLDTPDFVRLADAFGIRATAVEGLGDDFGKALASHLADPEPTLLVARAALAPPPTTSPLWYRQGPPAWADPLAGLG